MHDTHVELRGWRSQSLSNVRLCMGSLNVPDEITGSIAEHANAEEQEADDQKNEPELAFNVEQVLGYTTNNGLGLLLIASELG